METQNIKDLAIKNAEIIVHLMENEAQPETFRLTEKLSDKRLSLAGVLLATYSLFAKKGDKARITADTVADQHLRKTGDDLSHACAFNNLRYLYLIGLLEKRVIDGKIVTIMPNLANKAVLIEANRRVREADKAGITVAASKRDLLITSGLTDQHGNLLANIVFPAYDGRIEYADLDRYTPENVTRAIADEIKKNGYCTFGMLSNRIARSLRNEQNVTYPLPIAETMLKKMEPEIAKTYVLKKPSREEMMEKGMLERKHVYKKTGE